MEKLNVYLYNELIGELTRTNAGARFQYLVQDQLNKPLLSTSLPVKPRHYNEGLTGNWFTGLLPEGQRLKNLANIVGCDVNDYYSLLKAVGYECAGAVQIIPQDSDFEHNTNGELQEISLEELYETLRTNQIFSNINDDFIRVSIGGFQDKLCLTIQNNNMFLPNKGAISTHILKPERTDYPNMVESEAWATCVASFVTKCSKLEVRHIKTLPVLFVERYDRIYENGVLKRVHQEDFCQAIGLDVDLKYANIKEIKGNDPTYKKFAKILWNYSADPIAEVITLAKQMIVNLVLGNYDAHAKNYSILHDDNSNVRMSPMYDVVPIAEVEPRTKYLSIRINNKILPNDISFLDICQEMQSWGLSHEQCLEVTNESFQLVSDGLNYAQKIYKNASNRHKSAANARLMQYSSK